MPLLTAIALGTVTGLGAYYRGPSVAALAGWIAGLTTTLAVQAGLWLRPWLGGSPLAER